MLTLRAGLEAANAALDAELDALVVARFEMQAVVFVRRAPVTAKQRIGRPKENGRRNRHASTHGELDHDRIAQRASRFAEELSGKIWLMPVSQKRITMERVHDIERLLVEIASEEGLEPDACLGDTASLAACLLSLVRRESLEISLEARVVVVGPMKLAIAAHEPAGFFASSARRLVKK